MRSDWRPALVSSSEIPDHAKLIPAGSVLVAIRSISFSASPELTPGFADPFNVADRNRLKCPMTAGAVVSLTVTTLASGTIWPVLDRA